MQTWTYKKCDQPSTGASHQNIKELAFLQIILFLQNILKKLKGFEVDAVVLEDMIDRLEKNSGKERSGLIFLRLPMEFLPVSRPLTW